MVVVLTGSAAAGPSNQGSGKQTQDRIVAIIWTLLYCHTPTVDWVVPRSIPMTGLSDTLPAIVFSRGNRSQGWFSFLGIVFPLSDTKGFTLVSLRYQNTRGETSIVPKVWGYTWIIPKVFVFGRN